MRFSGVNPGENPEFIVVGLGNPGKRYEKTRHNVGFKVVDYLDSKCKMSRGCKRMLHYSLTDKCVADGYIVYFIKPQTFMNNSGMAVKDVLDYYRLSPDRMLVIHDDITLKSGDFKLKYGGGAGGHNGLKSIIEHLGTSDFPRLRIGVGPKPEECDMSSFVLSKIPENEMTEIERNYIYFMDVMVRFFEDGIDSAMAFFNQDV